jgi:hypothetical protein
MADDLLCNNVKRGSRKHVTTTKRRTTARGPQRGRAAAPHRGQSVVGPVRTQR